MTKRNWKEMSEKKVNGPYLDIQQSTKNVKKNTETIVDNLFFMFWTGDVQKTDFLTHFKASSSSNVSFIKQNHWFPIAIPHKNELIMQEENTLSKDEIMRIIKKLKQDKPHKNSMKKQKKQQIIREDLEKQEKLLYRAIHLVLNGYNRDFVCRQYSITNNQLSYYLKKYKNNKQLINKLIYLEKYAELKNWLFQFMSKSENQFLSLSKIVQEMQVSYPNLPISVDMVFRTMKDIGFSRKKAHKIAVQRNSESTKIKRKNIVIKLINLIDQNKKLIFIDETSFNFHQNIVFGYSPTGKRLSLTTKTRTTSITMLAAVTSEELLGFQLVKGGVNAKVFGNFVLELITNNEYIMNTPNDYILFLDNAPIHRSKILAPLFKKLNVLYSAPYSPFLNPIEEYFSLIKHHYRHLFANGSTNTTKMIIDSALIAEKRHFTAFYCHMFDYFEKCVEMEDVEE